MRDGAGLKWGNMKGARPTVCTTFPGGVTRWHRGMRGGLECTAARCSCAARRESARSMREIFQKVFDSTVPKVTMTSRKEVMHNGQET
jgi:hypothetical protein